MNALDLFFFAVYFLVILGIFVNGVFFILTDEERVFIGITSLLLVFLDGGCKFLILIPYLDTDHVISSWYQTSISLLPFTILLFILYVFTIFVECLDCKTDIFYAIAFHGHVSYLFSRQIIREWINR